MSKYHSVDDMLAKLNDDLNKTNKPIKTNQNKIKAILDIFIEFSATSLTLSFYKQKKNK